MLLLTFALGACGGSGEAEEPGGSGPSAGGADGGGLDGGGQPGPGAGGDGLINQPIDPGQLPELACNARPPAAYSSQCTGCHTLAGGGGSVPDLFGYAGSEAELIAQVRRGGKGMPAFSASTISDDALREAYQFLKGGTARSGQLGSIKPLFAEESALLPITFTRDDGVLVTRGAGRVRGRHELEGTYGPFGALYFEDRSYGFLVEDYTVKGESRVRVTYLPVARPEDKTNFRAFKIYGNGNVFHSNTGMTSDVPLPSLALDGKNAATSYQQDIAPYARTQSHELTRNAREGRPLQVGDTFEFEFGVFIDAADARANSRTAYYTDTFRYRVGLGGLTAENKDTSGRPGPLEPAQSGGGTTLAWSYAEPDTYFSQMALNTQHEHVQGFLEGRRLFHTNFRDGVHSESGNPVFDEQKGKLGPLFVTTSCTRCHDGNGGGKTLTGALAEDSTMAFKLYGASAPGNQLQLQEGSASLATNDASMRTLADGTSVKLTRPRFKVTSKEGAQLAHSARVARRLVGLGLLEAIDEQSLLARADPEDCDADGISGRPSVVADPESSVVRIGRFGWRAEKVSVEHQVADALAADLGVQSRVIPGANGEVELNDADLARLTTYMRLIGVPPQRDAGDAQVQRGELLFRSVGCANCHVPELTTGSKHGFVELRAQQIRPYTDLLLHDLGADLADESGEAGDRAHGEPASASEWRTPPLWGVGLSQTVQGYVALLHDGRAQSVLEAVLWHGGEAEAVRDRVIALNKDEREALLRFVESL